LPEHARASGILKRLLLGALVIVVASAAATSVAAFHEVDRVVNALKSEPQLQLGTELADADAGKPQTILLIGSDQRSKTARDYVNGLDRDARSDTLILLRLDPSKQATALLSIPRDLKVAIPRHGIAKINEAYTDGGVKLVLETVKQLTGLRINHVVNVDFKGFAEAVDRLGCVYLDIDRRYFNANEAYATIDLQPGYQKLCGQDALDFVRFRHEDNDLVRAARQQEFLSQAKQQFSVGKLFADRVKLIGIFGKYTRSDIRSRSAVLRLLKLALASAAHPVQEVHFKGKIGKSYVTATATTVKTLAAQFLGVKSDAKPGRRKPRHHVETLDPRRLGLEDQSSMGKQQAAQAVASNARLPVFFPKYALRGAQYSAPPRVYSIRARNGRVYAAYRMVLNTGGIGQYYGLQGTTWRNPPILKNPSETRRLGGRTFQLYFEGSRLRLVAWETGRGVYWLANTLSQRLSNGQMLAIAASSRTL
jgi:polyisoprenyl-teichoic acid--peptidoglycan teichoic acid transferase